MRKAAGVRADFVVVDEPDFRVWRLRILLIEVERARHTGVGACQDAEQQQNLNEAETHA